MKKLIIIIAVLAATLGLVAVLITALGIKNPALGFLCGLPIGIVSGLVCIDIWDSDL